MKKNATPKPRSAALLLRLGLFLDAIFSISGVPVMVAQGAYVDFRSAFMLLVFQLCYIVPQFVSTGLAEAVAARLSAPVALFLTVLASTGAGAVGLYALMQHSVFLFFFSRFLNGLFRHEKLLSRLVAAQIGVPASDPAQWALYGTVAGMILPGVWYDQTKDAIVVAQQFLTMEVVAAAVTGILAAQLRRTKPLKQPVAETTAAYRKWVTGLVHTAANAPVRRAAVALVAGAFLASVHQSLYAIVDPSILDSYAWTGGHLAISLATSVWGVPRLLRALGWAPGHRRVAALGLALIAMAGYYLPVAVKTYSTRDYGWAVYVLCASVLDVGAGCLLAYLGTQLREAVSARDAPYVTRLTVHIITASKLLGAALRLGVAEHMRSAAYPIYVVSAPLGLFVVVHIYTGSQTAALAVATAACATLVHFC